MNDSYRKGINAEHEARWILVRSGFFVTRCLGHPSPPDLIALKQGDYRLVMVRHSRLPVRNAQVASIMYADELEWFRTFGPVGGFRLECWIYAPPDGSWQFYEVLPKGIRRIRQEWEEDRSGANSGTVDEAGLLGEPLEKEIDPSGNSEIPSSATEDHSGRAGDATGPGNPGTRKEEPAPSPPGDHVPPGVKEHA